MTFNNFRGENDMAHYGNWPKKLERKLKEHWLKAKGDRDKFQELVLADDVLIKEKEWDACNRKARRMGFFKKAKMSKRYVFSQLDKEQLEELKKMLADNNIGFKEIIQKCSEFNLTVTEQQLRNFARSCDIKINKEKPGRKPLHASETAGNRDASEIQDLLDGLQSGALTEQKFLDALIDRREANQISCVLFLEHLVGELKGYWEIILKLLSEKRAIRASDLLPLIEAKNKRIRITDKIAKHKQNIIKGVLTKFVEWGVLYPFKTGTYYSYVCNLPGFHSPEETFKLVPDGVKRAVQHVFDSMVQVGKKPKPLTLDSLAKEFEGKIGASLLSSLLDYYIEKGVVECKKGNYYLTQAGATYGLDEQSLKTFSAATLENQLFLEDERSTMIVTLDEAEKALAEEMRKKTVVPIVLNELAGKDSVRITFLAEVLFGNQFTDLGLLNYILPRIKADVIVVSGLVQGVFAGLRVDKRRILSEAFGRIGTQYALAGELNRKLEQIARTKVIDISGDDDWEHAVSVARLLQLGEGKWWNYGMSTSSLSTELKRRLAISEYYKKLDIQWERVGIYQRRFYRSLLNADEVEQIIGVHKSEYRLIIEILIAKRKNFSYPKDYEEVVNVEALFGDIGKRVVTPDPAPIMIGDKEIKVVHNVAFSDITQYVDPMLPPEMIMRNLAARGVKLPFALVNCHQEKFGAHYLQGHWLINLPGMQNTATSSRFDMKTFNTRVLSSKSLRQETFRKEPVTPGVMDLDLLKDGRTRFHFWNNKIREKIEAQKSEPEVSESVCLLTDLQHGSITMCPELEIAFTDYCLYDQGSTRLWLNGDIIQGINYFQTFAENRPYRLVSIDSQQRFTDKILSPLIFNAPNLKDFFAWLGNHEYNTFGSNISGVNHLAFLEFKLQGYLEGMKMAGKDALLKNAFTISRIRMLNSHNPYGDIVNWPYFTDTVAGFKAALSHMWRFRGRGRTPIHEASRWMRGMAKTASDIDIMFGGHVHSFWMGMEAEKLMVQLAASASLSGYEMGLGVMSTVLFTRAIFSNRNGITIEVVPWQFLENYKLQSPIYKGKEELLKRPKRGTLEYKYGKMSPYIEGVIDELTQYREV